MRIKAISLSWFRGAAAEVALELDSKSAVIYGPNGSGKSSFIDAIEYVLENGRVGHLSHEYSGRKQEKGLLNTHIPCNESCTFTVQFADSSRLLASIGRDGAASFSGADNMRMHEWDYKRTVLRQDEVAAFISARKGDKYSALVPLLHLQSLEIAAENLRQLARTIEQRPAVKDIKQKIYQMQSEKTAQFGDTAEGQIWMLMRGLYKKYLSDDALPTNDSALCEVLERDLDGRISRFSADQQRHYLLLQAKGQDIPGKVERVRTATADLVVETEPLLNERLEILQAAAGLAEKLEGADEVTCPACGQNVAVEAFQAHVQAEQLRLRSIIDRFNTRRAALSMLADAVKATKATLEGAELATWRENESQAAVRRALATIGTLDLERVRTSCSQETLSVIAEKGDTIASRVSAATSVVPPDVQVLSADKKKVDSAKTVFRSGELKSREDAIDKLTRFICELEMQVREEIKNRSSTVIRDVSIDVQQMWGILHPGERIEDVRLYVPSGSDKAIDIALRFYGINQDSPRLTLSEGHRNSLGLCIFLAMAKREALTDRPLFLDDVVVSLDRNHRGMVAEILNQEFAGRQVVILTHDREWYAELKHQLPASEWSFKTLLPWQDPTVGIRWSSKSTTFEEARAQLELRPDSAGNDARKIMDVELALAAEKLQLRLPYLRGDKNDHRTAQEFLVRLIGDAPRCLQKCAYGTYAAYEQPIVVWREALGLLKTWANRGSHSFDLVRSEAAKLINVCEKALDFFTCEACGTRIWRADDVSAEAAQCRCGQVRWRYGKGR
jgi:energy-coupling factor transporter ATP-binding protein EcfA2